MIWISIKTDRNCDTMSFKPLVHTREEAFKEINRCKAQEKLAVSPFGIPRIPFLPFEMLQFKQAAYFILNLLGHTDNCGCLQKVSSVFLALRGTHGECEACPGPGLASDSAAVPGSASAFCTRNIKDTVCQALHKTYF